MKKRIFKSLGLVAMTALALVGLASCGNNGKDGIDGTQGPQGVQGETGPKGADGTNGTDGKDGLDGLSAYQIAVAHGFTGTEEEWLLSLIGLQGVPGQDGTNGTDGKSAYQIAVENGYEGDVVSWLLSLKGADGTDGQDGTDGVNGQDGARGTIWFTGTGAPKTSDANLATRLEGDLYFDTLGGTTYLYKSGKWEIISYQGATIKNVKKAVNDYIHSDAFIKSVITTYNGNATYLNSYLRYVDGISEILDKEVEVSTQVRNPETNKYETVVDNKTIREDYLETVILDKIKGFVAFDDEGNCTDHMTASDATASTITSTGWYSLCDFSFSWGGAYALYDAYLLDKGKTKDDNPYKLYKDEFIDYMGTGWYNDYYSDDSIFGALSKARTAFSNLKSVRTATEGDALTNRDNYKTEFLSYMNYDKDAALEFFGEENNKVVEWVMGLAKGLVDGSLDTPKKVLDFDAEKTTLFNEDTTNKWNNATISFMNPGLNLRNYINGLEDNTIELTEFGTEYNTIMNYINTIVTYLASSSSTQGITRNGPLMANRASFGFSSISMVAPALVEIGAPLDCPTLVYAAETVKNKQTKVDANGDLVNSSSCNWVGVSGVPMLATLFAEEDWFSTDYEKAHQAYYPTKNGWNFPWEDYITMDLMMDQFDRFAASTTAGGSSVDSRYAMLNMYSMGVDPAHYTKSSETGDTREYDYISMWMDEFEEGTRTLNYADAALLISYLVYEQGELPGLGDTSGITITL